MIIRATKEDIFETKTEHIAIPINMEGIRDSLFTGSIVKKYWPELFHTGKHELGDVITKKTHGKTLHAIVCHSFTKGWGEDQSKIIKECFDNIDSNDEPIATIAIGSGLIGMMQGADIGQILIGMQDSKQSIELYSDIELNDIKEYYKKQKRIKKYGLEIKN